MSALYCGFARFQDVIFFVHYVIIRKFATQKSYL